MLTVRIQPFPNRHATHRKHHLRLGRCLSWQRRITLNQVISNSTYFNVIIALWVLKGWRMNSENTFKHVFIAQWFWITFMYIYWITGDSKVYFRPHENSRKSATCWIHPHVTQFLYMVLCHQDLPCTWSDSCCCDVRTSRYASNSTWVKS